MKNKTSGHDLFRIILAFVFVSFGIVALGNNVGWWNIDDLFLTWWPLILVLLGFITVFAKQGSWGGGIFLIFLGVLFLLHTHGIYDISELIWPAMLVMVGFIVWPRKRASADPDCPETYFATSSDHVFNINTLFHGQHEIINDKQLSGGHASAVFGNLELDLRQTEPRSAAHIEITAVFGNVRISIPSNWNVTKQGAPVFGKVNDKRNTSPESAYSIPVTLEMNAVFGHIELTN